MKLTNWHRPLLITGALCTMLLLFVVGLRFTQFERASFTLPQLFIKFERSIGYDGFIHNFKNFVLRPDNEGYLDAAINDHNRAVLTLAEIESLATGLGIEADLTAVQATLSLYRDMLETAAKAREKQMTIREIDALVRVSDLDAALSLQEFGNDILEVMQRRRELLYIIIIGGAFSIIAAAILIAIVQSRRRQQAEHDQIMLKEQETFLLQAETIARLGRWKSNKDGSFYCSEATAEICGLKSGYTPASIEDFWKLIPAEDGAKLRVAVNEAMQSKGQFSCMHRMMLPDGSTVNVVDSGEVVLGGDGEVTGFVGTLQDVSQLVDMENELRQSQKMEAIGNLAGGMAHDFNNILAIILGNLELLQANSERSETTHHVETAIDATRRGADLTRNMLGFARRSHLNPRPLKANDLIRDVVNWSSRLLPATIEIETSLLANLWQFTADEGLAKNALLNLMLNARDAMPNGGRLTLETANIRMDDEYIAVRDEGLTPGRYVAIAVSDTGSGIQANELHKVFEPFYSTKPTGKGTGLGLSMVQGFMRQSGGTVRIYSEPGVGTTLKLYFKAQERSDAPLLHTSPTRDLAQIRGKRVLLVEDNEALLSTLEEMLTGAGLDVTTALSGDIAVKVWDKDRKFDLVATDIVMPGKLQGTHLAKAIRAEDPNVPFVFMSGYANEAMVHGNGLREEDSRLTKPVSRVDLLNAIADLLR